MKTVYIADQPALEASCNRFRGTPWLAIDTEFIREETFYSQLCLIQVSDFENIFLIDPLALPSLDPLLEILYDPAILKILHAAHQDLEIFYHLCGAVPSPVFDTQLVALALGHGSQIGYAKLVQHMLGVTLEKAHTRANWGLRPLPPEWLAYASDDVRYLPEIYQRQHAELTARGWLAALADDFKALSDPDHYRLHPQDAWQRVRDHKRLRGIQRAVLRALAAWREEQAHRLDRPRRWILKDLPLLEIARKMPNSLEDLAQIRELPSAVLETHGETLLARITDARAEPPEQWPARPHRLHIPPEKAVYVDKALTLITARAHEYSIPLQMLADRHDIERLLIGEDSPLCHGWRAAVIGMAWEQLQDFLLAKVHE